MIDVAQVHGVQATGGATTAPSGATQAPTGAATARLSGDPPTASTSGDSVQLSAASPIDGMLETEGPGKPTAEEAEQLKKSLGVVDPGALKLLEQQGLKIGVVSPGEDLMQMGTFRPVDPQSMQGHEAGIGQIDAALDQKFGPQMKRLEDQIAALPANDPKRQELDLELARLQGQRTLELDQALQARGIPARPLMPPLSAKEAANQEIALTATQVTESPLPTWVMGDIHGANTPERLAQFEQMLQGLNGERLQVARQEGLEALKAQVAAATPENRAKLQARLDAALADPTQVPIDHRKHNIVMPDLHYTDKGALSLHDRVAYNNWGDGGNAAAPAVDPQTGQGSVLNGQYFEDQHRILIRDTRVGTDTPVHELGHALEGAVQKADPAFYGEFEPRLMQAFAEARQHGSVSAYAQASPREYIAEGVAHYYEDPKALKATDPALYALTLELLTRASALGNR